MDETWIKRIFVAVVLRLLDALLHPQYLLVQHELHLLQVLQLRLQLFHSGAWHLSFRHVTTYLEKKKTHRVIFVRGLDPDSERSVKTTQLEGKDLHPLHMTFGYFYNQTGAVQHVGDVVDSSFLIHSQGTGGLNNVKHFILTSWISKISLICESMTLKK